MLLFSAKLELQEVVSLGNSRYEIVAYFIDNSGIFSIDYVTVNSIIYHDLSFLGIGTVRYKITAMDPTYISSGSDFKCTITSDNPDLVDQEPVPGFFAIIGQNDGFGTTAISDINRNEVNESFISNVRNIESYYSSKRIENELSITALDYIGGHRVVTTDGYYASCFNLTDRNKIAGISIGAATINDKIRVRYEGTMSETSWNWDITKPIYLGSDGTLVQSPPPIGFIKIIANVLSSSSIMIQLQNRAILL